MLFIQRLFSDPHFYFLWVFVVVFSVCCHEYAHAQVALWKGDPTAAERGHLTLNPLVQMGVVSLVMLAFLGIAWGQVPVNPARLRRRSSAVLVAFAGPAMNMLLAAAATAALAFAYLRGWPDGVAHALRVAAVLNVVLFIFNLLPVPPLDGWAVAEFLFPGLSRLDPELLNGAMFALFLLAFAGFGHLYKFASLAVAYALALALALLM